MVMFSDVGGGKGLFVRCDAEPATYRYYFSLLLLISTPPSVKFLLISRHKLKQLSKSYLSRWLTTRHTDIYIHNATRDQKARETYEIDIIGDLPRFS